MNKQTNAVFQTFLGQKTMFTRAFLIAGLGFLAICLIGFLTSNVIFPVVWESSFSTQSNLLIISLVLIMASSIVNIIWTFRVTRVSRWFIYFAFGLFTIAEGIGFGFLFSIFNLQDLSIIFGAAGLTFLAMAIAGYKAKDLSPMVPFLIMGSIAVLVMGLIATILVFAGVFSDGLMILWTILVGILTMAYVAFDVWRLKVLSRQASESMANSEMVFKFTAFFAFRLLSDFIALVWTIARLMSRFARN